MKKIISLGIACCLTVFFFIFLANYTLAEDKEATETSDTTKEEKIQLLKEKVASKVAELSKIFDAALEGSIVKIEENVITFSAEGKEKTVNTDDSTKILLRDNRLATSTIVISDLEDDDKITVIGGEQIGTDIIDAKLIVKRPEIIFFAGKITSADAKKGVFEVEEEKTKYTFDYEVYTKAFEYLKEKDKFETVGFTKLTTGMRLQILALPQEKSETRFTALKIILVKD